MFHTHLIHLAGSRHAFFICPCCTNVSARALHQTHPKSCEGTHGPPFVRSFAQVITTTSLSTLHILPRPPLTPLQRGLPSQPQECLSSPLCILRTCSPPLSHARTRCSVPHQEIGIICASCSGYSFLQVEKRNLRLPRALCFTRDLQGPKGAPCEEKHRFVQGILCSRPAGCLPLICRPSLHGQPLLYLLLVHFSPRYGPCSAMVPPPPPSPLSIALQLCVIVTFAQPCRFRRHQTLYLCSGTVRCSSSC